MDDERHGEDGKMQLNARKAGGGGAPPQTQSIDGAVYVGEWKCGKREGFGRMIWPDGSEYEGAWSNDLRWEAYFITTIKINVHAHTTHMYDARLDCGSKLIHYQSCFNTTRQGTGRSVSALGSVYEGNWRAGFKDGLGLLTLVTGEEYFGTFLYDNYLSAAYMEEEDEEVGGEGEGESRR